MQAPSPPELVRAAEILRDGRLVAMPTETVYGLAGDALNPAALALIFETKGRPRFDPLILHHAEPAAALALAAGVPDAARALADAFWPGPLTLVLPKTGAVPELATSGLPTVALRVPAHPFAQALLREFGGPLAAPSANRFGRLSPTTADAVRAELGDAVGLILDGGPCTIGVESTVIGFETDAPVLLRAGGVPLEEVEALVGPVHRAPAVLDKPQAPGQLASHYAPGKPLEIITTLCAVHPDDRATTGLLHFGRAKEVPVGFAAVTNLSENRDLREAAANFFAHLRALDAVPAVKRIAALRLPEQGLGLALNERLERAQRPAR